MHQRGSRVRSGKRFEDYASTGLNGAEWDDRVVGTALDSIILSKKKVARSSYSSTPRRSN